MATQWIAFPYADRVYDYAGAALKKAWSRLHRGDHESFPKDAAVADAWRLFHAGRFQDAVAAGQAARNAGIHAAVKAQCVHAHHLEADAKRKVALFAEAVDWAAERRAAAPGDANAHYLYAFALDRYGQGISVAKALAQGFGGKIRDALTRALELDAAHAEAAAAFGAYQSEVIAKVGPLVAGLTYGAKKESALQSFERAVAAFPESPIVHIEYANGLILLFDQARIADATRLYEQAAAASPADAMERLDVELAKRELA